jgi:hypothetical protein
LSEVARLLRGAGFRDAAAWLATKEALALVCKTPLPAAHDFGMGRVVVIDPEKNAPAQEVYVPRVVLEGGLPTALAIEQAARRREAGAAEESGWAKLLRRGIAEAGAHVDPGSTASSPVGGAGDAVQRLPAPLAGRSDQGGERPPPLTKLEAKLAQEIGAMKDDCNCAVCVALRRWLRLPDATAHPTPHVQFQVVPQGSVREIPDLLANALRHTPGF